MHIICIYRKGKQGCGTGAGGGSALRRGGTCGGAGLLQKKSQDGTQTTMEATLMAQQTPQQREQVLPLLCAMTR